MAEPVPHKNLVVGSIPAAPTNVRAWKTTFIKRPWWQFWKAREHKVEMRWDGKYWHDPEED